MIDLGADSFICWCKQEAQRCRNFTLQAIDDLSETELIWRPRHDANPIAWILWHIAEFEERTLWKYYHQRPLFRFKISCLDAAQSDLPSQVALLDYLRSVRHAYLAFIDSLSDKRLDELVVAPACDTTPISLRELILLPVQHEWLHTGQIAYIRRLMGNPLQHRLDTALFQDLLA